MKTIQFDVDGVLADFVLGFTRLARQMFGNSVTVLSTHEVENWNDFGLSPEQMAEVWQRISGMNFFWSTLPALASASIFESISRLGEDYNVVFVTDRHGGLISPQWQTVGWLRNQGVMRPNVVIARNKGQVAAAIGADYSIEDKPSNATAIAKFAPACQSFLINRKYNQEGIVGFFDDVRRIDTISEFLEEVRSEPN